MPLHFTVEFLLVGFCMVGPYSGIPLQRPSLENEIYRGVALSQGWIGCSYVRGGLNEGFHCIICCVVHATLYQHQSHYSHILSQTFTQ